VNWANVEKNNAESDYSQLAQTRLEEIYFEVIEKLKNIQCTN
jgi:hypothetical protein